MLRNNVSIVGATGAVGTEFLSILGQKQRYFSTCIVHAGPKSVGQIVPFGEKELSIVETSLEALLNTTHAIFCANSTISSELVPQLVDRGVFVVDNSSAFRQSKQSKLVIPQVNGSRISGDQLLYSVPNCTTIILLLAIYPIHSHFRVKKVVLSTYQSASGGGAKLMNELESQTRAVLSGEEAILNVAHEPYAFNLFSHNTPIGPDGYNGEETKVVLEARQILEEPELDINVTCIRVPVLRAHSESIWIQFEDKAPTEDEVREILSSAPSVTVLDDRANNRFPTPALASGKDEIFVGRIRKDLSDPKAMNLFVCGDQLRLGAALTAWNILERLLN